MYIAKPTPKQLEWQELELGVLIHYLMESYDEETGASVYRFKK